MRTWLGILLALAFVAPVRAQEIAPAAPPESGAADASSIFERAGVTGTVRAGYWSSTRSLDDARPVGADHVHPVVRDPDARTGAGDAGTEIRRHVPSAEVRHRPVHRATGLFGAKGPLIAGPSFAVEHEDNARRCRERELVPARFRQPHADERDVANVVARPYRGAAQTAVGLVGYEQREVLTGQVVGRVDAVGTAPGDDLPARTDVEPSQPQIDERLAQLAGRVAVLERPA